MEERLKLLGSIQGGGSAAEADAGSPVIVTRNAVFMAMVGCNHSIASPRNFPLPPSLLAGLFVGFF